MPLAAQRPATDRYELTTPRPEQFDELTSAIQRAYGGFPDPAEVTARNRDILEFDRTTIATHKGRICGTATIYSLTMTVPGGPRPVAGVGYVSVRPDHRRRGLMSRMLLGQFATLHEEGAEPVAALNSTEAGIYGRFGYGMANQVVGLTIPRGSNALRADRALDESLRVEATEPDTIMDKVADVYDANVLTRPGMLRRDPTWTRRAFDDPPEHRESAAPLQALTVDDGELRGYALYTIKSNWENSSPRNVVVIREVYASDNAAYAQLWATLLDLDLTATVSAGTRPVDDPIIMMLNDVRTAVPTVRDQLHVRVVDVDRALASRTYTHDIDLVIDIDDPACPWNRGRWRLSGGPNGAQCHRTNAAADLTIAIRTLGSAYLGGVSLRQLAAAGGVIEHHAGALVTAATAFRHDPAPFCPTIF